MSQSSSNFTAINIQTTFCDIFYFSFDLWIPFCKVMNSFSDLIKRYISFLPFRHLKYFQNCKDLSHFFVIFFHILWGCVKIFSNLFIHLSPNLIKFHWLRNNTANICQFLRLVIRKTTSFDLGRNSMNAFNNIDHIFESTLKIFFEVFLIGIKGHMLFS